MQARCSRVAAMNANAVRMLASAGGGLVAISWLDLGLAGFFAAVAVCCCSATLGPYPARASPACSHSAKCYVVILGVLTARSIPLSLVPSARWKRAIAVSTPHQTARLRLGLPLPRGSDITGAGLRRAPSSRHCAVDDHVPLRMGCVSLGRF